GRRFPPARGGAGAALGDAGRARRQPERGVVAGGRGGARTVSGPDLPRGGAGCRGPVLPRVPGCRRPGWPAPRPGPADGAPDAGGGPRRRPAACPRQAGAPRQHADRPAMASARAGPVATSLRSVSGDLDAGAPPARPRRRVAVVDPRRHVPRTDVVLGGPRLVAARELLGAALVKAAVARAQDLARSGAISPASVADAAAASLPPTAATLTPVINATGVVVHTNLGRAPLSAAARDALQAAAGCTDVEFDLASGRRGRRGAGALGALARAVPAAGTVHVVNNNAAALALAATALAAGREIIVSRGELIEIGDGFRLPDLLQSTGARIREVGTTNRTTLNDYRQAIGDGTAFILKVHPSNYLIEGFTASVSVRDL